MARSRTPHPLLRTIGLAIRARRRERGLSQESLADRAHLDRSYMSGVERGLRNISVLNIARIAAALDVPVSQLLGSREVRGALLTGSLPPDPPNAWEPGRYLSLG